MDREGPKDFVSDMKRKIMEYVHLLEYIESVSNLIGDEKALELLKKNIVDRRVRWFEENKKNLKLTGKPLEDAYIIMTERLNILDDAEIYMEGEKSITFKSAKPCPIHEACKIRGMDSKRICKAVCESAATEFLMKINPKLRFIIEHKKEGPEEFNIETIELRDE